MKKTSITICLLLTIAVLQSISIKVDGQEELEWKVIIKVTVNADGSASWIIERRTELQTEYETALFLNYTGVLSLDFFVDNIKSQVSYASLITGRNMRAENFQWNISKLSIPTGLEGVIQFQFDWVGFAENINNKEIKIGDTFTGELDLSKDDTLMICYPADYNIEFIYPTPDETEKREKAIIWYGPKNFGAGEPTVFLKKEEYNLFQTLDVKLLVSIITIVCLSLICLWLYNERRKYLIEKALKTSKVPLLSDEETVRMMLKEAGGSMLQSDIKERCGFSKAKISGLLKSMEEKGIIKRKRKGREKLVTLIDKR